MNALPHGLLSHPLYTAHSNGIRTITSTPTALWGVCAPAVVAYSLGKYSAPAAYHPGDYKSGASLKK